MFVDGTKRLELINSGQINTPSPTSYEIQNALKKFEKKSAVTKIRNQIKWHSQLSTVASIPEKTRVYEMVDETRPELSQSVAINSHQKVISKHIDDIASCQDIPIASVELNGDLQSIQE